MDEAMLSSDQLNETTLVLANIAEVTASTMRAIAGNDISTALNGETLTKQALSQLAISTVAAEAMQLGIPSV